MADPSVFKLFRSVDPSTVNVPIKEKFAKLTLSSNKKKQAAKPPRALNKSNVSRQLADELSAASNTATEKAYEHPLLRSSSSSLNEIMGQEHTPKALQDEHTQLDDSEFMDALQVSGDGCTQRTLDVDVERLSNQVSNLSVQQPPEISVCISTTTEEDDADDDSCIIISDTSGSECAHQQQVSEQRAQPVEEASGTSLTHVKVARIEAFLRDVSFERQEMLRRGVEVTYDERAHTRLASADTESMSPEFDCTILSACQPTPIVTPDRQTDSSKRLADDDTEVNTPRSDEMEEENQQQSELNSSKRLADNDTEPNTLISEPLSDLSAHQSTLNDENLDESVTIPETCSESEQTPQKSSLASSSPASSPPAIKVSNINISAKINIKISIPEMDSSSTESVESAVEKACPRQSLPATEPNSSYEEEEQQEQKQQNKEQKSERSVLVGDTSEDEQFLTQAEKLLNQLYGKSWQTPDVIRTLKRSSGSGGKSAAINRASKPSPLTEVRRQPKARCATTVKKPAKPPAHAPNESALGDFSIFRRALYSNKLDSTHLQNGAKTERRACKQLVRTKHIHEDRWRALVDTDSGTDASDDDDAVATDCSGSSNTDEGQITYLDLTKNEVEVVSSPDAAPVTKPYDFPKRLEDILRSCRPIPRNKIPATPATPVATPSSSTVQHPTRRQLFTPNTGYEDENEAKKIVALALETNSLDHLENDYEPGTAVHKRLQEIKQQLGILPKSPKSKPIFVLPSPQTVPPSAKPRERTKRSKNTQATPKQDENRDPQTGKYSFIKSLESQISREHCDNEAYFYRESFAKNKEQLAKRLYEMFNKQIFNDELNVPIIWSKLLRNTAGRCKNKKRLQERSSVVELSVKVLTSADRLRCTLIHELCHAAAWVFNGEGGHGRIWKSWAQRANNKFPDLPTIRVCHNYDIEYKYTYKCTNCNTASHAHSRSRKVENLRCRICRGPITLLLNKKDKSGNVVPTPVREATGFAKFVKENFQLHKRDNLTAAQVMRILSAEYAKLKAAEPESLTNQVSALVLDD